jgi:ADP-ribose pyrophosphatase
MSLTETTLSSQRLLTGIVFDVDRLDVRLADGSESKRDIVRHRGGVGVLARTPRGTWLLVRQYRKAMEAEVLEIVAGMREAGESPEESGRRELEEETGYRAATMSSLGQVFASPGYTTEVVHLFYAETEASPGGTRLDHDERVQVVELSHDDLAARMAAHELCDAKTVAAWYRAMARA